MKYLLLVIFLVVVAFIVKYDYVLLQKMNAAYLVDSGQSSRIFPHRVNSIGKLRDIWSDGIRSFEVDIYYVQDNYGEFEIGHDKEAMGGVSLKEFLLSVNSSEIERVWLDLKNLNTDNHLKILQRLEYLEENFKIKNKVLLESSITKSFFGVFPDNGWNNSYYLPTAVIRKLLKDKDVKKMEIMASNIARQLKSQNLSAVSFDLRLYSFTKQYLEPLIPSDIVYHTWWGPSLKKYNFKSKLVNKEWFSDDRIKTVLVKYKSQYHI